MPDRGSGGWFGRQAIDLPIFGLKTAKNDLYIVVLDVSYAFHMKKLTKRRILG